MRKGEMANRNNSINDNSKMDDEPIGPMEVGYILFTAPFILFCIGLVFMVAFNVR